MSEFLKHLDKARDEVRNWPKFKQESIQGTKMQPSPCHCIGRQGLEPYCPCRMRELGIFKRDGRWVQPERYI